MAYVDQGGQAERKKALIGVAAIHAGLGVLLVTGLTTSVLLADPDTPLIGTTIELPPPPTPEDVVEPKQTTPQQDTIIFVPEPPITMSQTESNFETTTVLPPPGNGIITEILPPAGPGLGIAPTPPPPTFDPISAKPKNRISNWVTTDDYRDSWISRDMTGIARFKLSVSVSGKVQDCQIVSSTGHKALDKATCKLVKRRARFNPARDGNGDKVAGSFTQSVRWKIPD
jgi:protein TonB